MNVRLRVQPRHRQVGHGRRDHHIVDVRAHQTRTSASGTRRKVRDMSYTFYNANVFNQKLCWTRAPHISGIFERTSCLRKIGGETSHSPGTCTRIERLYARSSTTATTAPTASCSTCLPYYAAKLAVPTASNDGPAFDFDRFRCSLTRERQTACCVCVGEDWGSVGGRRRWQSWTGDGLSSRSTPRRWWPRGGDPKRGRRGGYLQLACRLQPLTSGGELRAQNQRVASCITVQ